MGVSISFWSFVQDDSYLDSYISTIGVDFVSLFSYITLLLWDKITSVFCNMIICQKIRTVEQDGKTIKLQIVSLCHCYNHLTFLFSRILIIVIINQFLCSGIRQVKSVSEPSLAVTTEELMASLYALLLYYLPVI